MGGILDNAQVISKNLFKDLAEHKVSSYIFDGGYPRLVLIVKSRIYDSIVLLVKRVAQSPFMTSLLCSLQSRICLQNPARFL